MPHTAPFTPPFTAPYRLVHKVLLAMLCDALVKLGAANEPPPPVSPALLDQLDQALAASAAHMQQEQAFVHEPLQALAPRVVAPMVHDHIELQAHLASLQDRLAALRANPDAPAGSLHALYLALSQFVGDYLAHMAEEEQRMPPALQAHFSPAQLAEMAQRWQDAWTPADRLRHEQWMPRALNQRELDTWRHLRPSDQAP